MECSTPGDHVLSVLASVQVFYRDSILKPYDNPVAERELALTARSKVLATAPAGYVKMIDDRSLAGLIRSSLQPENFELDTDSHFLRGSMEVVNAPTNLAFDVIARWPGRERPMSIVIVYKGDGGSWWVFCDDLKDTPEHLDLVLRSNEKLARETVDIFEIWKGDIILPNVAVKIINNDSPDLTASSGQKRQ